MSVSPTQVAAAQARALAARSRLAETLGAVQQRLRPSNLAQDAVEGAAYGVASAARRGAEAVRSRPLAVAAVAGTVGLVMARGWIAEIASHARQRDETPAPPDSLKPKRTRTTKSPKKGTAR